MRIFLLIVAPAAWADTERSEVGAEPPRVVNTNLTLLENSTVWCFKDPWWVKRTRRSAAGITVWYYRLWIDSFCWTGKKIVLLKHHRQLGGPFVPCWDGEHLDSQIITNASWSWKRIIEAKFTWLCSPLPVVRTPEVWITLRGDGYHAGGSEA
jgi:hypothetical protein